MFEHTEHRLSHQGQGTNRMIEDAVAPAQCLAEVWHDHFRQAFVRYEHGALGARRV